MTTLKTIFPQSHLQILLPLLLLLWGCFPKVVHHLDGQYFITEDCRGKEMVEVYAKLTTRKKLHGIYVTGDVINDGKGGETTFSNKATYRHGLKDGVDSSYVNGRLNEVQNWRNGILDGVSLEISENTREESHFERGIKHGEFKVWENDQLRKMVRFEQGIKTGKEIFYDSTGQVTGYISYGFDTSFPRTLLDNDHEMKVWDALKDAMTLGDFLRYYQFRGTVFAYNEHPQEQYFSPREVIDPSLVRSLFSCDWPENKIGEFYLLIYSTYPGDQLFENVYLIYTGRNEGDFEVERWR
ncbi:MAG: hypothetical protein H6581_18180 [Bacteroidia bacterium]|nr:hypothetical protein [Bacteroidia bacterium]